MGWFMSQDGCFAWRTYAQVLQTAEQVGSGLAACGLVRGRVCAVLAANGRKYTKTLLVGIL